MHNNTETKVAKSYQPTSSKNDSYQPTPHSDENTAPNTFPIRNSKQEMQKSTQNKQHRHIEQQRQTSSQHRKSATSAQKNAPKSKMKSRPRHSIPNPLLTPQVELRLKLLPRIGELRSRNYISEKEEARFMKLLSETTYDDKFEQDQAVFKVKRELNQIVRNLYHGNTRKGRDGEINAAGTESSKSTKNQERHSHQHSSNNYNNRKDKISLHTENSSRPKQKLAQQNIQKATKKFSDPPAVKAVREPKVSVVSNKAKSMRPPSPSKKLQYGNRMEQTEIDPETEVFEMNSPYVKGLDQEVVETLFVEMCFFARMGFAQPPCCLACAHAVVKHDDDTDGAQKDISDSEKRKRRKEEEKKIMEKRIDCKRLVLWRKDSKLILRPDNIDHNIMLVTCSAAKRMLQGEMMNNWKWDESNRIMKKHAH